jgi:RNA polymerase sigma-70 factor (ECF subfamily)
MSGPGAETAIALVSDDDATLEREFACWLEESAPLPFRVAYGVLRNREDAEDVAQEALIRAHAHQRHLRDLHSLRAWLVRVSWRLAIDHRRSARRRARREQAAGRVGPEAGAEDLAVRSEEQQRLWQALDALPEKLRVVTILAAIQGHDVREVAALLELPEGTVKSRLYLARKRLAEELRWTTVTGSKDG